MKILVVYHNNTGVEYHRMMMPFDMISKGIEVYHIDHLDHVNSIEDVKQLEKFDVCVFNRNISPKMQPSVAFAALRAANVRIIMDMDVYWDLPKHHIGRHFYNHTNFGQAIKDQMGNSDMVWCTHKRLKKEIEKYNKNVIIVFPFVWFVLKCFLEFV